MPHRPCQSPVTARISTRIVEPNLIIHDEIVAFARSDHVFVAVGADLDGAAGSSSRDRGDAGEQIHLRLLAPEPSSHAAYIHHHRVGMRPERVRHHVLHFGRVLGRHEDRHLFVLARDRHCDLPLEVEVVLPADDEAA